MTKAKPPPIPRVATEVRRQELETSFTPILRRLRENVRELLAAAFVDTEGECIDYASSIDPFEAKVAGAHMLILMSLFREQRAKLGLEEPILLEIIGDERELYARRVSDEYMVVAIAAPGVDGDTLRHELTVAGQDFREEVGIAVPPWEPRAAVEVVVRSAVGWDYAPASFDDDGIKVIITDVLGRWNESNLTGGEDLVCFRVRTEDDHEVTLVHDPAGDGWQVRS